MSNGTEIHNEICNRFRNRNYSKEFLEEYTNEGCSKINKVVLEDIISNNNILIGYCDVVIDYEDDNGKKQKALIEVKSSADVINKDTNAVLRQIKKYKFYNKSITKIFLVYPGDASNQPIEDTYIFTDENITVLDINKFIDSEEKERLAQEEKDRQERAEKERKYLVEKLMAEKKQWAQKEFEKKQLIQKKKEEEREREEERRKQKEHRRKQEIEEQKVARQKEIQKKQELQLKNKKIEKRRKKTEKFLFSIIGIIALIAILVFWAIIGIKIISWYLTMNFDIFAMIVFVIPLGYIVISLGILYFFISLIFTSGKINKT